MKENMEMDLNITITSFSVELKPIVRDDNIKAFVTWVFHTDQAKIKIKWGTIRLKEFGAKKLLSYDPPAIKTRFGYSKIIFIDNLELYKSLCRATIKKFCEETGELENNVLLNAEEEINIDAIQE